MAKTIKNLDLNYYDLPKTLFSNHLSTSDFILNSCNFLTKINNNNLDLVKLTNLYFNYQYSEAKALIIESAAKISNRLSLDLSFVAETSQDITESTSRKIYEKILGDKIYNFGLNTQFLDKINLFLLKKYDPILSLNKRDLAKLIISEALASGLSGDVKSGIAMRAASEFVDSKVEETIKEHRAKVNRQMYNDPSELLDVNRCDDRYEAVLHNIKTYSENDKSIFARFECIVKPVSVLSQTNNNSDGKVLQTRKSDFNSSAELVANTILILDIFFNKNQYHSRDKNILWESTLQIVSGFILKKYCSNLQQIREIFNNQTIDMLMKKHSLSIEKLITQEIISESFSEAMSHAKEIIESRSDGIDYVNSFRKSSEIAKSGVE